MIATETAVEPPWPARDSGAGWEALATAAVEAALAATPHADIAAAAFLAEVSVRFTSDEEVRILNRDYRHKDKPTNVLSFPMVQPDLLEGLNAGDEGETLLGDIVLAHGVCAAEAADKQVAIEAHASHLIVHGLLHLLGYDHEQGAAEAEHMEELERAALATLGIDDPYPIVEA